MVYAFKGGVQYRQHFEKLAKRALVLEKLSEKSYVPKIYLASLSYNLFFIFFDRKVLKNPSESAVGDTPLKSQYMLLYKSINSRATTSSLLTAISG